MSVKHLITRGIGFGSPKWLITRGLAISQVIAASTEFTSKYAADHASAYLDVLEAGGLVTFEFVSPGMSVPSTGLYSSPTTTSVVCAVLGMEADTTLYQRLGLVVAKSRSFFIVPQLIGVLPQVHSTFVWVGETLVVKHHNPFSPDGVPLMSTMIATVAGAS